MLSTEASAEKTLALELADKEKTLAFINIVHETKTPLTLINHYLSEYLLKHPKATDLHIVQDNLSKLDRDLNNLFDLERSKNIC